jgi:hypothetical protein
MNYDLIQERAEIMLEHIEERIEIGIDTDKPDFVDAYKGTYCLAKRDLNLYKRSFHKSGLQFDVNSVEAIWEEYSHLFESSYQGLSREEVIILNEALDLLSK